MKERIKYIDAVKGISMLMIFFIHMENWIQLTKEVELIQRIIYKGNLGVEFTYLINSYLLCNKYKQKWGGVIYNTLRILPLYFLYLIICLIYCITGIINEKPSFFNIASHFLMLAWLNPDWWCTFPGSGYIQILFLMWLLFPIFKKYSKDFETSLFTFAIIYLITNFFYFSTTHFFVISSSTQVFISYICRGFNSFALGILFYYIPKIFEFKNKKRVAISLVKIIL